MPGDGKGEFYFILISMIVILIGSFFAVFLFIRLYKKEMREKEANAAKAVEAKKAQTAALAKANEQANDAS